MIAGILALAGAQPAHFADLPGVAVSYYDVNGRDVAAIHKSLQKAAPRDPVTNAVLPATSSWTVDVAVKTSSTGKSCRVTAATLRFHPMAVMPRLAPDKDRPAAVAKAWDAYVAQLEARQAAQLGFAYARIREVERAAVTSRCDRAGAAIDAALARLTAEQRAAFADSSRNAPKLEEPGE